MASVLLSKRFRSPISTKDIYHKIFTKRSEGNNPFSSLIAAPTSETELLPVVNYGSFDESKSMSTTTAKKTIAFIQKWYLCLEKDAEAGEFNEEDLKRHIPRLRTAAEMLTKKMTQLHPNSTPVTFKNWWDDPKNIDALDGFMQVLEDVNNCRTTSAKLRRYAFLCLDFLTDIVILAVMFPVMVVPAFYIGCRYGTDGDVAFFFQNTWNVLKSNMSLFFQPHPVEKQLMTDCIKHDLAIDAHNKSNLIARQIQESNRPS